MDQITPSSASDDCTTSITQTSTAPDIHHTGHPPHQTSTTSDIHHTIGKKRTSTTTDIHHTRKPPHHMRVWVGGCPSLLTVWWISGVVDFWCGGCLVWWMSGVVGVVQSTATSMCLFLLLQILLRNAHAVQDA